MLHPPIDSNEAHRSIAGRLGGTLEASRRLVGGASAEVTALEIRRADGSRETLVVRRHDTSGKKPLPDGVTRTEHALLTSLHGAGLPVPQPRLLDESCQVLPGPYLVIDFVEGEHDLELTKRPARVDAMAVMLASLHELEPGRLGLPALPSQRDPVPELLEYLPEGAAFDRLRTRLRRADGPVFEPRGGSLLHGDYWPGNLLWNGDEIAAVLDWEDAALGDPCCDLATARLELAWRSAAGSDDRFTERYRRETQWDSEPRLALWDALAAAGALAFMDGWGLEPLLEDRFRAIATSRLHRCVSLIFE